MVDTCRPVHFTNMNVDVFANVKSNNLPPAGKTDFNVFADDESKTLFTCPHLGVL